jgi:hypothetical protein
MKRFLLLFVLLFTALAFCQSSREQAATDAATNWLKLTDAGLYNVSWDAAAPLFQNAVTKERWSQALRGVRTPLGNALSRRVKSAKYTTTLPGAPDGEYVVIQFETSFENKSSAIETVTPMLAKDGTWRVSGYFIR